MSENEKLSDVPAEGTSRNSRAIRLIVILLAALIAAAALLALLPQTRGALLSWAGKGGEVYCVYRYDGELEPVLYRPTWLPEGYELKAKDDVQQLYTYKNEAGAYISYTCYNLKEPEYEGFADELDFVKGVSEVKESTVDGSEAKLFTGDAKALVWKDEERQLLFMLYSPDQWCGDGDLQKMAESVRAQSAA